MTQEKDSNDKFSVLRSQAEELLGPVSVDQEDISALSPEEAQVLVHDLRIHQIELEMQNEELRQAQIKLEELKDKYLDLYDFAPVGYMTLNDRGLILEANLTAVGLLGMDRTSLIKMFFSRFVCQEFTDTFYLYLQQVFQSQSKQACEIKLTRKDGTVFYAQLESIPVQDENGQFNRCRAVLTDITERKLMEEELKKSEERYRGVFNNAVVGIMLVTEPGRFMQANSSLQDMLGYTEEELKMLSVFDITFPEDIQISKEKLDALKQSDLSAYRIEKRYVRKDGALLWVDLSVSAIRDSEGQHIATIGVISNITDRRRMEEEFRISEEKFSKAFFLSPDAIMITRLVDGMIVSVNEGFNQLSGYAEEEVIGKTSLEINVWDNPEDRNRLIKALKAEGKVNNFEFLFRTKDGAIGYGLMSASIIELNGTDHILIVTRDITERKRWEQELQNTLQRFYTILSTSFAGVLLVTNENIVEFVNQAMCDLFDIEDSPASLRGLTAHEMIGKLKNAYEQPSETLDRIRQVVSQGMQVKGEEVAIRGGRTYLIDYLPIEINNKPYGRLWHHTDITARKKAEQDRENLRAQLLQSQKMATMGTLAGGIAHDFNNMLTVILGYSSFLLADKNEKDPGYKELQKIVKTSQDAADLVQKIRIFGRKAEMNLVPLDLNHQVDEVTKLLSSTLPKMIDIEIHLTKDPVIIKADPSQITQMVMNLAVNANEAMPQGGRLSIQTENIILDDDYCRVHLGAKPGPHVMLTVSDTGRGIDKGLMERIFDPFYSTKTRDYRKGTGLGLSVVQGIVQQHGGNITVESEVGKGTIFRMYFPALEVEIVPEYVEKKIPYPAGGTETILLVEDMDLVRELGVTILEKFGYTVLSASDGQEALDVYEKEQGNISLVILDIIMPRMDGKQCLEQLLRINPDVKVIISSGVGQYDLINEVVELGAKGVVNKPYGMRQLLAIVREALDRD